MSRNTPATRGWLHWPKHAFGKGAVALVGAALVGVVAVTTAWASVRTAAPVHLYWANNTPGWGARPASTTIGWARLDGTGVEHSFVSGAGRIPCGVALDRKHIYWAELLGGAVGRPAEGGAVGRANRDGSGVDTTFIPTPGKGACGVAIAGGHIYWPSGGAIARANVDGTGVDRQFIPGLAIPRISPTSLGGGPCGIAVAGKYIYWMNAAESRKPVTIGRANLDGTGVNKRLITGVTNGCGIAVGRGAHLLDERGIRRLQARDGCDRTRKPRRDRGQPAFHPHRKPSMVCRRLPGSHLLGAVHRRLRTPEHDDRTCQPQRLRRQRPVHYRHPRHMRRPRRAGVIVRAYSDGVRD